MAPRLLPVAAALAILVSGCSRSDDGDHEVPDTHIDDSVVPPAPERIAIEVTGDDYRWHLRYPGADGVLGNQDDVTALRDVHLPAHTPTILELRSRDYVYKLRLPHLNMAEIAVPRQEFALEFDSGPPGAHELRGDQFCGFTHPELIGNLIVDPPREFMRWMGKLAPVGRTATEEADHR